MKTFSTRALFIFCLISPRAQGQRYHSCVVTPAPFKYSTLLRTSSPWRWRQWTSCLLNLCLTQRSESWHTYTPHPPRRLRLHPLGAARMHVYSCAREQRRDAAFCQGMEFKSAGIAPAWCCISVGWLHLVFPLCLFRPELTGSSRRWLNPQICVTGDI